MVTYKEKKQKNKLELISCLVSSCDYLRNFSIGNSCDSIYNSIWMKNKMSVYIVVANWEW